MHHYKIISKRGRNLYLLWGLVSILTILILTTCNQSFEPLQENDKYYFSIYGYLDVSADTQWVRINPARQNINASPDPFGIQVTLENVETGQSDLLNDSLFSSKNFLNYWTTMDIENEQTYRLKAERTDGKFSQVTVTTPKKFPLPLIFENTTFPPYGYYIIIDDDTEHIADVQSIWYVRLNPDSENLKKVFTFNIRNSLTYTDGYGGAYLAYTTRTEELNYIESNSGNNEIDVVHRQIFVASAGQDWDENIPSLTDLEYFLDGTASNVENGLGYVVGVDSKRVPLRTCYNSDRSNIAPCYEEEPFWY